MSIFSSKKSAAPKAPTSKKTDKAVVADEVLTPESQQAVSKGSAAKVAVAPPPVNTVPETVYVFNVPVSAEKIEIAKAVGALYGVTVEAVRTARGIGKRMVRGKYKGRRNQWKKAYVCVKPGQKIDLYEGV